MGKKNAWENEGGDSDEEFCSQIEVCKAINKMYNSIRADMGFPPRNGFLKLLNCTIYDEELFASPPPPPDCPICFLPMSLMHTYQPCCGKNLCDGCMYAHKKKANEFNCPFCRHPVASTNDERFELTKKRMTCSDSNAFVMMGVVYLQGTKEIKQDFGKAVALWENAAELGSEFTHVRSMTVYSFAHECELHPL